MKKIKSKILLGVGAIVTLATTGSVILSCGSNHNPNPKDSVQDKLNGITTDMVTKVIQNKLSPDPNLPAPVPPIGNEWIVSINGLTNVSITIANYVKHTSFGYLTFSIASIYKGTAHVDGAKFGTINISGYQTRYIFSQTTGINASNITCMIYTSEGKYFVGTRDQGLWVSNDGINFTQQSEISNSAWILSLYQASNGHIFVGTNGGLWKSVDGGATFTNIKIDSTEDSKKWAVNSICQTSNHDLILGVNPNDRIISTTGLWRSTDGGENFTQILNSYLVQDTLYSTIYQTSNGNIYVGTGAYGLWKSIDGGVTFTQVISIGANSSIHSIYQISNGNIYATTLALRSAGLFVSTDDGGSFTQSDVTKTNRNVQVVYQTSNGDIFIGADKNGLLISKNDGVTFNPVDPSTSHIQANWDVNVLFQAPNVDKLFVGMDEPRGLWASSE